MTLEPSGVFVPFSEKERQPPKCYPPSLWYFTKTDFDHKSLVNTDSEFVGPLQTDPKSDQNNL